MNIVKFYVIYYSVFLLGKCSWDNMALTFTLLKLLTSTLLELHHWNYWHCFKSRSRKAKIIPWDTSRRFLRLQLFSYISKLHVYPGRVSCAVQLTRVRFWQNLSQTDLKQDMKHTLGKNNLDFFKISRYLMLYL